jgi:hypothetical protein
MSCECDKFIGEDARAAVRKFHSSSVMRRSVDAMLAAAISYG